MSPTDRKIADIMTKHRLALPALAYLSQRIRHALKDMYKFGFGRGKVERSRRTRKETA